MVFELQSQLTPGEIARRLNEPLHRTIYVLDTRKIPPLGRVGITRIFADTVVEVIRAELAKIDANRRKGTPAA